MTDVWASMTLASVACGANLWAAFHCRPTMRSTYGAITILAAMYVGAFAALIWGLRFPFLDGTDRAAWSRSLSWAGYVVWSVVWTLPAIRETKSRRELDAAVAEVAEVHGIDARKGR